MIFDWLKRGCEKIDILDKIYVGRCPNSGEGEMKCSTIVGDIRGEGIVGDITGKAI